MKRLLALVLSAGLLFSTAAIVGCGGEAPKTEKDKKTAADKDKKAPADKDKAPADKDKAPADKDKKTDK